MDTNGTEGTVLYVHFCDIALCSKGCYLKKKTIRKCSTLKIDFSANFHLTRDFLLAEALSTPKKLENAKKNLQISI